MVNNMVQYMNNQNSGFNMWNANRNAAAASRRSPFSGFLWWMLLLLLAWWAFGGLFKSDTPVTDASDSSVLSVDTSSVPTSEISSDRITATVQGLRISNVRLSDYTKSSDSDELVSLLGGENNFIEVGFVSTGASAPTASTAWRNSDGTFTWRNPSGVEFRRTITTNGYTITVTDTISNGSDTDVSFAPYARIVRNNDMASAAGVSNGAIAYVNSDIEDVAWNKLDSRNYAFSTTHGFAGFADQYWETVASIDSPDQTITFKKSGSDTYVSDTAASAVTVAPGGTANVTTNIFVGPRDQDVLDAVEPYIAGISQTIDYGWFWFLARPMLWVLNGIHHVVLNYGLAIIVMTLLLRLLMWPLTRKSYTSMAAMQKMQPEMQRIQKLYANDKMRLQMEMMKLYQTHKTSPMSGCLPMLIQIPIFFALYKALLVSVAMRNANFLWIHDLSAMDPYFILPILMGLTMWLQQRLQSAQTNKSGNDAVAATQRAMRWMPLLFTVMFAWMPAGLVLYWTVSNIFGIIQMQIIKHKSK